MLVPMFDAAASRSRSFSARSSNASAASCAFCSRTARNSAVSRCCVPATCACSATWSCFVCSAALCATPLAPSFAFSPFVSIAPSIPSASALRVPPPTACRMSPSSSEEPTLR
eukprot:7380535-Prymnesium_polylepis.2